MVPLKQLKPKSAGVKIKQNKVNICPADPQNSYFKRDVLNITLNLKEKLKKKNQLNHIFIRYSLIQKLEKCHRLVSS